MPIRPADRDNLGSVMIGPSLDVDAAGTINTFKADINTSGYGYARYTCAICRGVALCSR
jgi:hypothetical protein